jgi:CubicO group peptidase (beta-lactamase class C family)
MQPANFQLAVQFATDHETPWDREVDGAWGVHPDDPPLWNRLLGPVHGRGPVSGVITRDGLPLSAWGEPDRADLTFSIAKTHLALLAGVAHDRGLMPDVAEPVCVRVRSTGFDDEHNASVTWAHLLQQTSEWQGVCFGLPDEARVEVGGRRVQSVPGGTHWDGGLSISAQDQIKVAQLFLGQGSVNRRQIVSSSDQETR